MDRTSGAKFDRATLTKSAAEQYSSSDSDSDDQDAFQIPSVDHDNDDFADHNPRKRRRTGRDAKESAALGIFGSESEDDGPSSRWKHKNLRRKGVAFVSSTATKKDDEDEDDEDEEDNAYSGLGSMRATVDEDEEEEDAPMAGLGLGAAAQRVAADISWSAGNRPTQTFSGAKSKKNMFVSGTPLGQGFIPSSSFMPEVKARDEPDSPPARISRPSAFSSTKKGKKGGSSGPNPNSFGARMMAKMGYTEGTGLGAEGQGRNVIIEANLRPQRAGLGVVKEKTESERQEEKRQAKLRGEVVVDSDEEEKKRKAARKKKLLSGGTSTPGSGTSTPRRPKQKYLTLDEIKKTAPGLNIPDAFTPILDMTGPGRKMLTTSSGLMTPTGAAPSTETVEQAESRKLARRVQNDFMAILEEWQGLQERKAYAELQLQQAKQELDETGGSRSAYKSTIDQLGRLSLSSEVGDDSMKRWDHVISVLKEITKDIHQTLRDSTKEELHAIAVASLHPVMKDVLQTWEPLLDDRRGLAADLASVGFLLGISDAGPGHHVSRSSSDALRHHRRTPAATPYETMMYKVWLPHTARAVREWNVRDSDQMLNLWNTWSPILPEFIRKQLMEQDIVRKLEHAVARWEPKKRKGHHVEPHMWIFPWLQFLPAHHLDPKSSTGLVADVKRKFRHLIDAWDFGRGVVPGLAKWQSVLRQSHRNDQWRPLLMSHVLPSMARYLRKNFEVDPSDQAPYMAMLEGVFAWVEIVSPSALAEVVAAEVFPKWHERLHQWLTMDSVDYVQVSEWLDWWRESVFAAEIKANPSIIAELAKGERAIEMALELGDRAKAELPAPEMGPALASGKASSPPAQATARKPPPAQPPTDNAAFKREEAATFRQQVEDWCQSHDLQFIPERTKVHAKGPLYRITARGDGKGGVLAYFEGGTALRFEAKGKTATVRSDEDFFVKIVHPGLAG